MDLFLLSSRSSSSGSFMCLCCSTRRTFFQSQNLSISSFMSLLLAASCFVSYRFTVSFSRSRVGSSFPGSFFSTGGPAPLHRLLRCNTCLIHMFVYHSCCFSSQSCRAVALCHLSQLLLSIAPHSRLGAGHSHCPSELFFCGALQSCCSTIFDVATLRGSSVLLLDVPPWCCASSCPFVFCRG